MKLSVYAKKLGISYKTAWRMWKDGNIENAYQLPTGTVIVEEPNQQQKLNNIVCIYSRVSSSENKSNLEHQSKRLEEYAVLRGYKIYKSVKEIGSGLNDNRKLLSKILVDNNYNILLVEHKDRLTRFGFNYIDILFKSMGKTIEVVNISRDDNNDLMDDFISVITSFCARIYGQRRCKRKTEKIIQELKTGEA